MEKRYKYLRCFAYSLEIILFFVIMGIPNFLPEIAGSKPCLLVALALSISLFERELMSMIFGAICGLFTDLGYSNTIGFFTISLCIVCYFLAYSARNIAIVNIVNSCVACLIVIAAILCLHFLFYHSTRSYHGYSDYFLQHYISRIFYTFVFIFPFFYLNRLISTNIKASN